MDQRSSVAVCVAICSLLACSLVSVRAADHSDSPSVVADPASDLTDVYAWMTSDGSRLNLVLNVANATSPDARFSDAVQYAFHVQSSDSFGLRQAETDIIAQFDSNGNIELWVGDNEFVSGNASVPTGLTSSSGRVKVFAGARNDPFFFNAGGFQDTVNTVKQAAPGLQFDGQGCPQLDAQTSAALVSLLASTNQGTAPPRDAFAGANVLALVVQVDVNLVNQGGPLLGVWASTHRRS